MGASLPNAWLEASAFPHQVNIQHSTFNTQHSTFNIKIKIMKANTWKTILQIAISVLTAIATTLGVTSCSL